MNGTVTVSAAGDIAFTDKAILNWGVTVNPTGVADGTSLTNFRIATGETYNFASAGSVLNKVTAGTNTTHSDLNGLGAAAAVINGTLNGFAANVYILANGNITVGNGAVIRTQSLTLSTLTEQNDQIFIATGNLLSPTSATPGASTGNISLGTLTASGNLTAAAGTITNVGGGSVSGDLVLRSITAAAPINLASTASMVVSSNLSVTTNGGAITEGSGISSVSVASGGTLYTALPTVTFTAAPAGGSAPTAAATSLNINSIALGGGGTGYTAAPTVTFTPPPPGGLAPIATAVMSGGVVTAINVTSPGTGYTVAPSVTITGANTGAATATSSGTLAGISITSPGTGYVAIPGVTLAGGTTGVAATAAAQPVNLVVGGTASLNTGGTGTITLNQNRNDFQGVVTMNSASASLRDANILTLGTSTVNGDLTVAVGGKTDNTSLLTNGPVTITGNASLISTSSANASISIANNSTIGGWVSAATAGGSVTINTTGNLTLGNITTNVTATDLYGNSYAPLAATVTGALAVGETGVTPNGITLGAGFNSSPIYLGTVGATFSSPIASATPLVNFQTISVTNGGSGFTAAPAIAFSKPPTGGTAPTAHAVLTNGVVTGIIVDTAGVGYTSVPGVTIADAPSGGTNASGAISSLTVVGLTSLAGGSGYTATPTVTFVGGGRDTTTATATATLAGDVVTNIALGGTLSGFTSVPSIVVAPPTPLAAPAQGRALRDSTTGLITSFEVTNAGVGYITPPTISFTTVNTENNYSSGGVTAVTTGNLTTTAAGLSVSAAPAGPVFSLSSGIRSGNGASLTGANITTGAPVLSRTSANSTVSFNATAGSITFNDAVTGNRVSANTASAGGNITQPIGAIGNITTTSNSSTSSTFNAGANGTISLDLNNDLSANGPINITAKDATVRSKNSMVIGTVNVGNNVTINASGSGKTVTLGTGTGIGDGTSLTVGNILTVMGTNTTINDNDFSIIRATGGLNILTNNGTTGVGNGNVTIDAALLGTRAEFGQVNVAATGNVVIAETTTLNLGNIGSAAAPVASLRAISTQGGIIDSGSIYVSNVTTGNATFIVPQSQTITLDSVGPNGTLTHQLPIVNIIGGGDSSITGIASNVVLGNATSIAAGNVTVGTATGFGVTLGSFDITGSLTVNSGSWIDVAGSANITGDLALNATGNIPNALTLSGTGGPNAPTFGSFFASAVSINNTGGNVTSINATNFPMLSFAAAPTVTLVGGSVPATPATIPATIALVPGTTSITTTAINSVATGLTSGGTGYFIAPNVVIAPPSPGGTQATATATVAGGVVTGIAFTNAGSGYTAAPTITLVGGGNPTVPAIVTANINPAGEITGFTVANGGGGAPAAFNNTLPIRIDIAGATTTSITETTGVLRVSGQTSVSSPGNALLFRGNDFNTVLLNNTTGGAVVNDVNTLSISGNSGGAVIARSGANGSGTIGNNTVANAPAVIADNYNLSLGNLNVNALQAIAMGNGDSNSGTVTQQSGTSIHSETLARFETSSANITIGNNGNSFGRVELSAGTGSNSHNITFVEDGTIKLGNVSERGTTNITSRFGSIIEDTLNDVVISNNGTLSATANAGNILIGNTTHTVGTTTANIVTFNATAPNGAVAVTSNNSTTLGSVNANSLTVSVTGGNGNITQTNALRVFGTSSFSATRNITLTNNANNFGRVFLSTTNATRDIQITEGGTLNLGGVSMGFPGSNTDAPVAAGNFTATSVNGDIIDTGLGGVRLGGLIAAAGVVNPTVAPTIPPTLLAAPMNIIGTGTVTLNAANGNIVLDDPTTDFFTSTGINFNAVNVTLAPLGTTTLVLGNGNVTGNLTVTSATGSITNTGVLSVTGDAFFQSGSGDITVTNAANKFGTVKFAGRNVSITEADDMGVVTGSSATGTTILNSGGNITIVNRGGIVTLARSAFMTAAGGITLPKLIQIGDTLTMTAAGTKDLSSLSISGDLAGKSPINLGSGTYLPPQP